MPRTKVHFREANDAIGPLGAKLMSERPFIPVAPALTNALRDATRLRFTELPLPRSHVWLAIDQRACVQISPSETRGGIGGEVFTEPVQNPAHAARTGTCTSVRRGRQTVGRRRTGTSYDKAKAPEDRRGTVMRSEAVSKNRPTDLISIVLEKAGEAGLELPGLTTPDALAAKVRTEVSASTCVGINGPGLPQLPHVMPLGDSAASGRHRAERDGWRARHPSRLSLVRGRAAG